MTARSLRRRFNLADQRTIYDELPPHPADLVEEPSWWLLNHPYEDLAAARSVRGIPVTGPLLTRSNGGSARGRAVAPGPPGPAPSGIADGPLRTSGPQVETFEPTASDRSNRR